MMVVRRGFVPHCRMERLGPLNGAFNTHHLETPAPEPTWVLPIDVYETPDGLVQTDKTRAGYRGGVLEIPLPTPEGVRPREITIEVAKKD